MAKKDTTRDPSIYTGIFLISLATLLLEISLTRIFSVALWYHFAFMIISIALFGFGASGTFLLLSKTLRKETRAALTPLALLFSISTIAGFLVANRIMFDPFKLAWDMKQVGVILLYYILIGLPFFFSGSVVGVALSKLPLKANKLYFSNLLGAALGSLGVIFLTWYFPGSRAVFLAAAIGALSALSFGIRHPKRKYLLAWLVLSLVLLSISHPLLDINSSPYKSLNVVLTYPETRLLSTTWNPISKVDVIEGPVRYFPGLSYTFQGKLPGQLGLSVDNDNLNGITRIDSEDDLEFTEYLPYSIPYSLGEKEREKVLLISPGGGLTILPALNSGVEEITVLEPNPLVVETVRGFGDYNLGAYQRSDVQVRTEDVRSFLRASDEKFDLIDIGLTDNPVSSSTGLYALSENYLFTEEAFSEYLSSLTENGVLSVTRWLLPPPRAEIRTVALMKNALEASGLEPRDHVAAIRSVGTITILMKKTPFTRGETEAILEFSGERNFDIVYLKGAGEERINIFNRFPEPIYHTAFEEILGGDPSFSESYLFNIGPVSDDRPFFYHFFRWKKIIPLYKSMGNKWQPFIEGGYLTPIIFIQALFLSMVFILLPAWFKKVGGKQGKAVALYFGMIGIGFMFIEISLIQKFILYLGQPLYSLSIILFSILLFSSLGSFFSRDFKNKTLRGLLILLALLVLVYSWFIPLFFEFSPQGLQAKAAASALFLFPLGFLMGTAFPAGIKLTNRLNPGLIPWAWAVNGCLSVLGAILAVVLALSIGFSRVLLLAGLCYLTASVVFSMMMRKT